MYTIFSNIKKKSANVTKVTHALPDSSCLCSSIIDSLSIYLHMFQKHPQLTYGNALIELMLVS